MGTRRFVTLPFRTEAALALLAGVVFFGALAAVIPVRDHLALILLWGAAALYMIVRAALGLGPLYGVPLAIAAGLAFDAFYIPPYREFGSDNWQNWLVVVIYIAIGTLIGALAARTERQRAALANEQAALRRVATLVANAAPPTEIFGVVAEEVGNILGVRDTRLLRFDDDGDATILAQRGVMNELISVGSRTSLEGDNVARRVLETGRPAPIDDYTHARGALAENARAIGLRSAIAAPIVVDGRLWGAIVAGTRAPDPLPPDTESRIGEFTALVATAISNVQARADLAASRARVVAEADAERRRVARDLHDGAQQRLVHTIVTLRMTSTAIEHGDDEAPTLVNEALEQAETGLKELRELARGILPTALTWGGLAAGVDALASRMPIPVDVDVGVGRLDARVEASVYFVVAEALTNVAKHSHAQRAAVSAALEDHSLRIKIEDDGVGGADPGGHGLTGMADRLASLDGELSVVSEAGCGTTLVATVPVRLTASRSGTSVPPARDGARSGSGRA
jgi:signal transduction histidine kinase